MLVDLTHLQNRLSQPEEALFSCQQAIAAYDMALQLEPGFIPTLNSKGCALMIRGYLQTTESALASWQTALATFEHSLKLAPRNQHTRNCRDKVQAALKQLGQALSES